MGRRLLQGATVLLTLLAMAGPSQADRAGGLTLRGFVESVGRGLAGYEVSLHASFERPARSSRVLGRATTRRSGEFEIDYRLPHGARPLLFLRAERGRAMLVSALGRAPVSRRVTLNERTTVATAFAFAQFVDGRAIRGNRYGMRNAAHMAANMASPSTGRVGAVLGLPPNGPETTTLRTFNSLANIVASCTATGSGCRALFDATALPDGPRPRTVLQAVANIAKYPWLNVATLFDLSFERAVYRPALAKDQEPAAWALFLKFTGSFSRAFRTSTT